MNDNISMYETTPYCFNCGDVSYSVHKTDKITQKVIFCSKICVNEWETKHEDETKQLPS